MKKFITIIFILFFGGCAGYQIPDTAHHNTLAYGAGKAFAITIARLTPPCTLEASCVDKNLTAAWVRLMDRNKTNTDIPVMEMIAFYGEVIQIFADIALPINDPYGVTGDLSTLLLIYAATFNSQNGEMVSIKPVPVEIMKFFERGYENGRKVARENEKKMVSNLK